MPNTIANPVNRYRRQLLAGSVFSTLGAVATPVARAQSAKTLRLVVPFPPGGSTDVLARVLANLLAAELDQDVVVENKPGAGGTLGSVEVARAKPDGRTLLMGHVGTLAVNPALYPNLPYDPQKSFTPVALVARVPNLLVVPTSSPYQTLGELIAHARAHPGALTYASGGNGSAAHITFEYLKLQAQIDLLHIPYKGGLAATTDLIGGRTDTTFTGVLLLFPHIQNGYLRPLAVSSRARIASFPDVPTVAESGYPDFEADQWYGFVAPAGTPEPVVQRLNQAINKALRAPEVIERLSGEGAIPIPSTPQAFADLIAREIPRWADVVRASNATVG